MCLALMASPKLAYCRLSWAVCQFQLIQEAILNIILRHALDAYRIDELTDGKARVNHLVPNLLPLILLSFGFAYIPSTKRYHASHVATSYPASSLG
jgi:hypothetical protein